MFGSEVFRPDRLGPKYVGCLVAVTRPDTLTESTKGPFVRRSRRIGGEGDLSPGGARMFEVSPSTDTGTGTFVEPRHTVSVSGM